MNEIGLAYFTNLVGVLSKKFANEPLRIIFMGYPDIVVFPDGYEQLLSTEARQLLVDRPNSHKLAVVHKGVEATAIKIVPTIESLLKAVELDCEITHPIQYTIYDFQTYEGCEKIHDFNEPIGTDEYNKYHFLWNGGTLEHIFDISTALMNMTYITREGGVMYHVGPLNMVNHGFVNLCPVLFDNFFAVNGCRTAVSEVCTMQTPYITKTLGNISQRMKILPDQECSLIMVGEKLQHRDKLVKPTQGRYTEKDLWV